LRALWLAEGGEFVPPGAGDFNLPPIFLGITKPMLLAVLSVAIIMVFFLMAARRLKVVPSKFTFVAESVYDFGRNNIARELIGSKDFMPYVPLIVSMFTFVLVNNIFGIIPIVQFPTFAHIGFPLALSLFIVYPLWHWVGIRKHGFFGHIKHQLVPPGVPKPVLVLLVPVPHARDPSFRGDVRRPPDPAGVHPRRRIPVAGGGRVPQADFGRLVGLRHRHDVRRGADPGSAGIHLRVAGGELHRRRTRRGPLSFT
jgi:hypothetical protein